MYTVRAARRYFLISGQSNVLEHSTVTYICITWACLFRFTTISVKSVSLMIIKMLCLYGDCAFITIQCRSRPVWSVMSYYKFTNLRLYIFRNIVIIFISDNIYRHWREQCKQTAANNNIIKWHKKCMHKCTAHSWCTYGMCTMRPWD